MTDWIKAEDSLPEPLEPVLIWYEYYHCTLGEIKPEYGIGFIHDGKWCGDAIYGTDDRVIAWMPLPKSPEENNPQIKHPFIELPCKIGDTAWGIRNYRNARHAQAGTVSEMFFTENMKLVIVIKYVCRGIVGETVFLTQEEAEKALEALE